MAGKLTKQVKVTPEKVDRAKIMEKSREIAKQLWWQKLTPAEKEALNQVARAYGLDPLLRHLLMLGGNIYITVAGLLYYAHRDKENAPKSIILTPASPEERERAGVPPHGHFWKCILKKGEGGEFVEFGYASEQDVHLHNAGWKDISNMAKTRALGRALRLAYSIHLPVAEEMSWFEFEEEPQPSQPVNAQLFNKDKEEVK